ncbi:hypothetical protein Ctob_013847 [Chrysochromulina tobinii]|uniref:Uncharacterized protein n=1 Tax=Chrysochromulina tobinii TaxID=1460289 RepID=A0A0M0JYD0_9EUKA|nr:hypothetical protein Ctob_013847 [Chrysochromulina tobinii]|eukprot:KOO31560.1 hypothetical protein Ctob_013847 [Chrysochromulina sp. CCMP291]
MGFEFAQLGGEPKYLVKLPELSESGATMSPCFAHCPRRALRNAHEIAFVDSLSAQTKETGTLAKYLKSLGVQITEVDLDVESDEDEEDEAGHPLVDDEAQEAVDEDEDDDL